VLGAVLPWPTVLGSCAIHLTESSPAPRDVHGDLGPVSTAVHAAALGFDELEPADVVIMESTYGSPDAVQAEAAAACTGANGRCSS